MGTMDDDRAQLILSIYGYRQELEEMGIFIGHIPQVTPDSSLEDLRNINQILRMKKERERFAQSSGDFYKNMLSMAVHGLQFLGEKAFGLELSGPERNWAQETTHDINHGRMGNYIDEMVRKPQFQWDAWDPGEVSGVFMEVRFGDQLTTAHTFYQLRDRGVALHVIQRICLRTRGMAEGPARVRSLIRKYNPPYDKIAMSFELARHLYKHLTVEQVEKIIYRMYKVSYPAAPAV